MPIRLERAAMIKILFLIVLSPLLCMTVVADYDTDEIISIEAKHQPLSQVLHRLSQSTGYTFTYDEDWTDLNISVKVMNLSLDKTLRKILNNHNFAILYEADGNIRIMIYDDADGNPDARTTHESAVVEYGNIGSAAIGRDESLKEENDENENETATEPESSDDSKEEPENETEDEKEIADEDERAGGPQIAQEKPGMDDDSPELSSQETENVN